MAFKIAEGMGYGDVRVVFKYFDGDDTITVRSTEDLLEAYNFLDGQPAERPEDKRHVEAWWSSLRVTLEDAMENGINFGQPRDLPDAEQRSHAVLFPVAG